MTLSECLANNKTFIIAEIGNNHNGSVDTAKNLIDIAAEAGVDAVKFQTFRGRDIVSPTVKANEYKGWVAKGFDYWVDFLDTIALPLEDHKEVYDYAYQKGVIPFSTPTSPDIVDFLESIDNPIYKIASMDLTNVQLLRKVANTRKPVILSTGMGSEEEIERAIAIFKNNELVVLHCVSDYPTKPEDANLLSVKYLNEKFGVYTGLSDHSVSNEFAIGSVVLGAKVIEKHITYNRQAPELAEHHFALEPDELKNLVASVRIIEKGIGQNQLVRSENEIKNKLKFRRSLLVNKDMKKGTIITEEDISILRPNVGDAPELFDYFIGKTLTCDTEAWQGLNKNIVK